MFTNEMIRIRKYLENDYRDVSMILKEAELFDPVWDSEENIQDMIQKDPESVIVAVANNNVVGNLFIIYYGPKLQYLFRLAVKKEYRKKGIAMELLEYARKIAEKRNVSEIGLYADSENK
jgi:ribosomal protein S18 acetylase RimI-like enzyme